MNVLTDLEKKINSELTSKISSDAIIKGVNNKNFNMWFIRRLVFIEFSV